MAPKVRVNFRDHHVVAGSRVNLAVAMWAQVGLFGLVGLDLYNFCLLTGCGINYQGCLGLAHGYR